MKYNAETGPTDGERTSGYEFMKHRIRKILLVCCSYDGYILEEDGHIYMEDMNAAAGTFKNGIQLRPYERVELLREDEVKFGKLEFTYR